MASTSAGTDIAQKYRQNDRKRENMGGIQEQLATISLNACNELWAHAQKSLILKISSKKILKGFPFVYRTDMLPPNDSPEPLRGLF